MDARGRSTGRGPVRPTASLLATGALLALGTFVTVLNMPDLPYHPARDLELKATYDAYRDTGVLLVKENGTGSLVRRAARARDSRRLRATTTPAATSWPRGWVT